MARKIVASVDKAFDGSGVVRTGESRGALRISTGALLSDIVVGGGRGLGFETGEVVLIESQSGAGKTLLGHHIVASGYHAYKDKFPGKFRQRYVDKESGATFDSEEQFGLEIVPKDIKKRARPATIQDQFADAMSFIKGMKDDEYGVYVVDSVTSFFDEAAKERADKRVVAYEKGRDYEEASMGMEMAKYLSAEYFKGLCPAVEESNLLYVMIAQYRQKKLPSGGVYLDLQNGEALKYYANVRLKITVAEEIVVKGRQVGAVLRFEGKKVRGPWPYRQCFVTLYYDYGLDNTTSNVEYLYDLRTATGVLAKAAEKPVVWDDQEFMRVDLVRYIEDNGLEEELDRRVYQKWQDAEKESAYLTTGRKKKF